MNDYRAGAPLDLLDAEEMRGVRHRAGGDALEGVGVLLLVDAAVDVEGDGAEARRGGGRGGGGGGGGGNAHHHPPS